MKIQPINSPALSQRETIVIMLTEWWNKFDPKEFLYSYRPKQSHSACKVRVAMILLTEREALKAILLFLQKYNERNKPDDTSIIIERLLNKGSDQKLSTISILDRQNIEKNHLPATTKLDKINQYTERQAFEAMVQMLDTYYNETNSTDIGSLLGDLLHGSYGETSDPAAWYDWQECLQQVISERQTTEESSAKKL